MDIKQFLEQFVQGYLFADLDSMAEIKLEGNGNCNYPIVMAVAAGIELLGTLTYPHHLKPKLPKQSGSRAVKKEAEMGNAQFDWYWKHFLTPIDPDGYEIAGQMGDLIRSLLRNGLAHTFLVKPGIEVRKFQPESHMKFSSTSRLIIDSTKFARDFKRSYWEQVRPIIDGNPVPIKRYVVTLQTMQDRLSELSSTYEQDSDKSFVNLRSQIPADLNTYGTDMTGSFNFPPLGTVFITTSTPKRPCSKD